MEPTRRSFKADKVSGIPATLCIISPLAEVVGRGAPPIRFPFWGLTWHNLDTHKTTEWIYDEKYRAGTHEILELISREGLGIFVQLRADLHEEVQRLHATSFNLIPTLSSGTDEELATTYEGYMESYIAAYAPGGVTFLYESYVSEELAESLGKRHDNVADAVTQVLESEYVSFMVLSARALRAIRNASGAERQKLKDAYIRDFFFITGSYEGGEVVTDEWVEKQVAALEPAVEHAHSDSVAHVIPTPREQLLIDLLRESEAIRDMRKRINITGSYTMTRFLEELSRRTGIDVEITKRMFWNEFRKFLENPEELVPKLLGRKEISIGYDGTEPFYLEHIAITPKTEDATGQSSVRGTPAARGKVVGPARIVLGSADFKNVRSGDVLISEMTRPDYLGVMHTAAAFVTDEGGLTCHAAIVARELKKPCVVGTKNATRVFKDGDTVEVDANVGTVTRVS